MKNKMISRLLQSICLAGLIFGTSGVYAVSEGETLASKNGCLACHTIDKKLVGPSYKEVATKYKGVAGADATLIAKVKAGGVGTWGKIPMPANSPKVSDADIKTIVVWILGN